MTITCSWPWYICSSLLDTHTHLVAPSPRLDLWTLDLVSNINQHKRLQLRLQSRPDSLSLSPILASPLPPLTCDLQLQASATKTVASPPLRRPRWCRPLSALISLKLDFCVVALSPRRHPLPPPWAFCRSTIFPFGEHISRLVFWVEAGPLSSLPKGPSVSRPGDLLIASPLAAGTHQNPPHVVHPTCLPLAHQAAQARQVPTSAPRLSAPQPYHGGLEAHRGQVRRPSGSRSDSLGTTEHRSTSQISIAPASHC